MLALMASSASRASSATTGSPRGSIRLAFSQSAELERLPDRTDSEMLPFEDACSYRGSSPMPALPPVPAPQPSVGCQTAVDWDLAAELLHVPEVRGIHTRIFARPFCVKPRIQTVPHDMASHYL
ncbi:hypothetical protein DIPPA_19713 [Diplonema papillatum]|nr:hypothetical protein DIPPA_19713 [Diplonema papillatum]